MPKLNPLQQRQWQSFKQNRWSYYSLWIFTILFGLSIVAEFIANDKPLLVHFDQQWYFPIFKSYSETTFGGDFETEADYREPFVKELINDKGWMLWPLIPYSHNTVDYELTEPAPAAPSERHWLGTDDQGRDVLARIIYGFRISVCFGLILTLVSSILGVFVGAIQGYYGGMIDLGGQRLLEIWSSLPELFILIILSNFIAPNFWWLLLIMLFFRWTMLVDLVRAEFLRARNFEYVLAAKALGVRDLLIIYRHILPNAMVATLTFLPFILNGAITTLTSLDFLGFGLPPGSPSLGELLAQGKANLHAPWLGLSAFFTLATMLSLLIFIGSGIRDAYDPRLNCSTLTNR